MSDPQGGRFDDIKTRLRDAVGDSQGDIDVESVMARMRETVERAGHDVDADAIIARAREAIGSVEGKVNADSIRAWIDDVDRDTIQSRMGEAKAAASGAAAFAAAQAGRLAERAPGAFDKVVGVAKEALGDFTGNQNLAREGELQHLKGDIESRFAETEVDVKDAADAARSKLDDSAE